MIWLVLGSILPAAAISFACGFVIRRYAPGLGLVDRPGERKDHATTTPTGGGLAIWLGVVLPFAAGQIVLWQMAHMGASWLGSDTLREFVEPHLPGLAEQAPKLWTLLAAATAMLLLGLFDDKRGLDWRLRLVVQTIVALFMVWQGWRLTLFLDMPLLTATLSVVWIVGLVNAFNMLDNMDGLSAGVAGIAAAILAVVTLTAPDPITQGPQLFVGGFLLVLVGSLVGFLWHNRPPARLFMGDAGSYLIGFCIAAATISATFADEGLPRHAILAPLCVLAIPIYDTLTVVWIRLREGRSPFAADKNHFSHRLVELGLSRTQAVLVIYLATGICGLGAMFLHEVATTGALVIFIVVCGLLGAMAIVDLTSRRRRRN